MSANVVALVLSLIGLLILAGFVIVCFSIVAQSKYEDEEDGD